MCRALFFLPLKSYASLLPVVVIVRSEVRLAAEAVRLVNHPKTEEHSNQDRSQNPFGGRHYRDDPSAPDQEHGGGCHSQLSSASDLPQRVTPTLGQGGRTDPEVWHRLVREPVPQPLSGVSADPQSREDGPPHGQRPRMTRTAFGMRISSTCWAAPIRLLMTSVGQRSTILSTFTATYMAAVFAPSW